LGGVHDGQDPASLSGFPKAWERAVSFQSRMTSPEDPSVAEATGVAAANASTVA
jgi:hypothetical protein